MGHQADMAKVKAEKKNLADLSVDSGTDTDSDGSDVPELEENTGAGASANKDSGIAVRGLRDYYVTVVMGKILVGL